MRSALEAGAASVAPHMVAEQGQLGERVQQAALLAASEASTEDVKKGATALRQILRDEQRRVRWAADGAGAEEMDTSSGANELLFKPAEGADALRLRLTLVRSLLRCRLDAEALVEATAATSSCCVAQVNAEKPSCSKRSSLPSEASGNRRRNASSRVRMY